MANIQQAAKWLGEGKKIRRPAFMRNFAYLAALKFGGKTSNTITTTDDNYEDEPLFISDLLAEDWEVAE